MEERLKRMEEDVQKSQEEAVEKAAKRARLEKAYKFKKRGHQAQSEFNDHVAECMERATTAVARRPTDESTLAKAKEALEEGLVLIASRQKLIKIADRSEFGWAVVAEYEADDLASGSEDERRLEKAEKAAEKKSLKKRKATAGASSRGGATKMPYRSPAAVTSGQQVAFNRFQAGVPSQQTSVKASVRPIGAVGPCYGCGEMGHLKRSCTKTVQAPGRWYPDNVHVNVKGTEVSGVREDDVCSNEFESGRVCDVSSTLGESVVVVTKGVGDVKPSGGRELVAVGYKGGSAAACL